MNKQLVHSVFESIALQFGADVAIEHNGGTMRYSDLNRCANRLAHALHQFGVERGEAVAAYFESSPAYVVSILGIAKAGGAFMPLEPDFPVKRLGYLLNEVNPRILIIHEDSLSALLSTLRDDVMTVAIERIFTIQVDDHANLDIKLYDSAGNLISNNKYPDTNLDLPIDGNDTGYLIYTSGSTGHPKIIEGVHKGLSHFIHWEVNEFNLDKSVRASQLSPVSFDVSFRDIFVPLLVGGTLCIPEKETKFQSQSLLNWIIASKVTLIHSVPTLFRLLTDELGGVREVQSAMRALKYILLAGEPLFGRDVLKWRSFMGQTVELVNIYGPSETTLAKMFHRVNEDNIDPHSIIPLGKAISNTMILILNEGKLCQPGEAGYIFIKTPFRSKGYFRNETLTKEKFIQNPLHNDFEDIVYDTGDMGKYMENKNVLFLGRKDNQIKIRGNRIELLEIERVMMGVPGIKEVAVVIINDEDEDKVLACYFTGDHSVEGSAKRYIANYLPAYMHPSFYIELPAFPLNRNGKIDKGALPKPEAKSEGYQEPLTELEKRLESIWKDVLKVPSVGRNDGFFNIGGSSLKGIKIISRIYKEMNVKLSIKSLFTVNATIKNQALEILATDSPNTPASKAEPVEQTI